jgi:hypothetical protein
MERALWIIAGALAVVFALSGLAKSGVPKDKLAASSKMGWVEGFSQAQIRWIAGAEFCGGGAWRSGRGADGRDERTAAGVIRLGGVGTIRAVCV